MLNAIVPDGLLHRKNIAGREQDNSRSAKRFGLAARGHTVLEMAARKLLRGSSRACSYVRCHVAFYCNHRLRKIMGPKFAAMTSIHRSICFVIFIGLSASVVSQETELNASALPPDVRLVIDVSGSMKRNDPNNLRQPAVNLLVQLLPDNSKAGVWTFGRWVNMLVTHREVDDSWRQDALAKSEQINSAGLFTNIGEALEKASTGLSSSAKTHRSSIILLTDGMVDIDKDPEKNKREWRRIVDEVLPKLQASGVTIHTIALSDNADTDLLNKLSLNTDGFTAVAKTADELMKIFLKAFDVAAPMEQVPLSDEGFVIDSSVEEFTALIFRQDADQQTQLVGPDGEVHTAQTASKYINWYRDNKYDLITVKQPLEGQWQVIADMAPESRITVVSNLNLRVKPLPNNILKGQRLELSFLLSEDGKTVESPDFLSLMSISASMTAGRDEFDLKEFWQRDMDTQQPPANGVFSQTLPEFSQEGVYQLSLVVDGKSFVREFSHQFATRQPFGADIAEKLRDGASEYLLTARAYAVEVDVANTQVIATVTMPDDRKKVIPLAATELDTWQTSIRPDQEGRYVALIRTRGKYSDGSDFDIEIEPIEFTYSIDQGFVESEKPFVASPSPEPSPEPPEVSPEVTPEEEPAAEADEATSAWVIYAALGVGNLLLFGLGFFAYKKIMGGPKEDVLEQFSEEKVAEETAAVVPEDDGEEEEEPPMEDIDPVGDANISEGALDVNMMAGNEVEEPDQSTGALDDAPVAEPAVPVTEPDEDSSAQMDTASESVVDDLDDLDQMAMEAEEDSAEPEPSEESKVVMDEDDDDMVAAMLKAQGLDLAEDELDDAISSLIDELESGDDTDEDEDKS